MHIRLLQAVAGRLLAEGVKDSSDEELKRSVLTITEGEIPQAFYPSHRT